MGTVGFPLVGYVDKDHAQPFPCQDCSCGCVNAEQCWRSCCCHTNVEKVAWAKAHGVTPPSYVVVAALAEVRTPAPRRACAHCAADKAPARSQPSAQVKNDSVQQELHLVLIDNFRKCRGQGPLWQCLAQAVPPVWPEFEFVADAPGEWLVVEAESFSGHSDQPAAPPPRV